MKFKKLVACLILVTLAIPLVLYLLSMIRAWDKIQNPPSSYVVFSPYQVYFKFDESKERVVDTYLINTDTKRRLSLYPYGHYNAYFELPGVGREHLTYKIGKITYTFKLSSLKKPDKDIFRTPTVTFYMDGHIQTLSQDKSKLYIEQADGHWPFKRRKYVCTLPSEDSFFDPIPISGLDGYAVAVLSADSPGVCSQVSIYVFVDKDWTKAKFVLPDGESTDAFQGYIHRYVDYTARQSTDAKVGTLELCQTKEDGSVQFFQVTWSGEALILVEGETYSSDILTNWTY